MRKVSYVMVLSFTGMLAAGALSGIAQAKGGGATEPGIHPPGAPKHTPHILPPGAPAPAPGTEAASPPQGAGVDAPKPAKDQKPAKATKPAKAPKPAKAGKPAKTPAAGDAGATPAAGAPAAADAHAPGAPDALHPVRQGGALPGAQ